MSGSSTKSENLLTRLNIVLAVVAIGGFFVTHRPWSIIAAVIVAGVLSVQFYRSKWAGATKGVKRAVLIAACLTVALVSTSLAVAPSRALLLHGVLAVGEAPKPTGASGGPESSGTPGPKVAGATTTPKRAVATTGPLAASGAPTTSGTGAGASGPTGTPIRPDAPTVDQAILSQSKDDLMVRLTVGNRASDQQLIVHAKVTLPGTGSFGCTHGPSTAEYRYTLDQVLVLVKTSSHGLGLSGGVEDSQVTERDGERYLSPVAVSLSLGSCKASDVLSMDVGFATTMTVDSGNRANISLVLPKSLVIRASGPYIGPHELRLESGPAGTGIQGQRIKIVLGVEKNSTLYSISSNFAVAGLP